MKSSAYFLPVCVAVFLVSCSKTEPPDGLKLEVEYQNLQPAVSQGDATYLFSAVSYVFSKEGVSVYYTVSQNGDIFRHPSDGKVLTGADGSLRPPAGAAVGGYAKGAIIEKGQDITTRCAVLFGPGDRMPVLDRASYRVQGATVYIDGSQHHTPYFDVSECQAGSEVMTLKNNGLILESVTTPGFILTANMAASGFSK